MISVAISASVAQVAMLQAYQKENKVRKEMGLPPLDYPKIPYTNTPSKQEDCTDYLAAGFIFGLMF